jgi:hypothetical protein
VNGLCVFASQCDGAESAAAITASVALLALVVNTVVTLLIWRHTRQYNHAALKQARDLSEVNYRQQKELEGIKRSLDLAVETRRVQLSRLRELQRSAERTKQRAIEISQWQATLVEAADEKKSDTFIETAGEFLIAAAGIFAPPNEGAPNLPQEFGAPLRALRRETVRLTLLLDATPGDVPDPRGRANAMQKALERLSDAVERFVDLVEVEEKKQLPVQ